MQWDVSESKIRYDMI